LPPKSKTNYGGGYGGSGVQRRNNGGYNAGPTIKVPSKGYDLDNLPPEAFADGVVEQFKASDNDLKGCRSCGRSFNPESLLRHQKICNKVFNQKRKEYNAANHRVVAQEQK